MKDELQAMLKDAYEEFRADELQMATLKHAYA
jgi:hypothetical protein